MIEALRAANSDYDKNIAFLYVDWDQHSSSPISIEFSVRRQSTLIMVTGGEVAARMVAETNQNKIQSLLDKAPGRASDAPSCTG